MTQDTGMAEGNGMPTSTFWRGAVHVLAGGLAGIGARDGNDAIFRGAQIGASLQNSYIKDQQFQQGMIDRQRSNRMRDEEHKLNMDYKRARMEDMQDRKADDGFLNELKEIQALSGSRQMQYKSQSMARLTARKPTDGSLTYPINEKDAERIQAITKGHETLSEMDMLIYSIHEAETGNSKKAKRFADILGMKHGVSIEKSEDGNKFIKTKFGAFPLDYSSAGKIKALYEKDIAAQEASLADTWSMRQTADAGARKHLYGKMEGLNLDGKDMQIRADEFARQIRDNPIQAKTMDFAHTFDRLVRAKDQEFSNIERAEVINKLKKSGIEFHLSDKGEPYINAKQFDDAVNRLNPGERVDVIGGSEMVKVDENLVSLMYGRSGLDNLSQEFTDKATADSKKRDEAIAKMTQAKFAEDLQGKMNDQRAGAFGDDLKASAKEKRIALDIQRNRLEKHSFEEIVDNTPVIRNNPEVLDIIEQEATEWAFRNKQKSTEFNKLDQQFRNQFGTSLKKTLEGDGEEGSEMKKLAISWLKENTDTSKLISPKMMDGYKKNLVRKFLRDPEAYMKSRGRVNSFNKAQKKANSQIERFNKNTMTADEEVQYLIKDAKN